MRITAFLRGVLCGISAGLLWQLFVAVTFGLTARSIDAQDSIGFFLVVSLFVIVPFTALTGGIVNLLAFGPPPGIVLQAAWAGAAVVALGTMWRFGTSGEMVVLSPFGEYFWRPVGYTTGHQAILFAGSWTEPYHACAGALVAAAGSRAAVAIAGQGKLRHREDS